MGANDDALLRVNSIGRTRRFREWLLDQVPAIDRFSGEPTYHQFPLPCLPKAIHTGVTVANSSSHNQAGSHSQVAHDAERFPQSHVISITARKIKKADHGQGVSGRHWNGNALGNRRKSQALKILPLKH
jgi:hypothetical protein